MKERQVSTRTQQIILDSRFKTSGNNNEYVIDLKGKQSSTTNAYSNVFFNSFDSVVGIKILGVYIRNTKVVGTAAITAVDVVCPQIPQIAQQLSGPKGYVWCRVPLIRNYAADTLSDNLLNDQWWEAPTSKTQYFPPTSLTQLDISLWTNNNPPVLWTNVGAGAPDNENYIIAELTYLDRPTV